MEIIQDLQHCHEESSAPHSLVFVQRSLYIFLYRLTEYNIECKRCICLKHQAGCEKDLKELRQVVHRLSQSIAASRLQAQVGHLLCQLHDCVS